MGLGLDARKVLVEINVMNRVLYLCELMGPIILRILWKSRVHCARDVDCLVFSGFEITI
jgi:hypothetical protein